jgi:hypothetical protein
MAIQITFATLVEDRPGASWQALFERLWPAYRAWFLRSGTVDRPGYLQCRRAVREHMPELVSTWERLVELAGGGDVEARFLSMWCPPRYITGCTQAVWVDPRAPPTLLRAFHLAPAFARGTWLAALARPRVITMGDFLWGALGG